MNQINLDKLLKISASTSASLNTGELKLAINQLYNARLQMLAPGQAQLSVLTPQGPMSIPLNREQLAQLKLPTMLANTAATASQLTQAPGASSTMPNSADAQTLARLASAQTGMAAISTESEMINSNNAKVLALQLQFSELPGKTLQLQLSQQGSATQVTLTQPQAQQLILSLLSLQLAKQTAGQPLPVKLNVQTAQLQLAITGIPAQPLLQFSAARNQQLLQQLAPELLQTLTKPATANAADTLLLRLALVGSADGKQLQLVVTNRHNSSEATGPLQQPNISSKEQTLSAHALTTSNTASPLSATTILNRSEQQLLLQQLLPLLPTTAPAKLKNANSIQLGLLHLPLPNNVNSKITPHTAGSQQADTELTLQLQLQPPQQDRWSLQWRPLSQLGQLTVSAAAFNRPLQLLATAEAQGKIALHAESVSYKAEHVWRQLLPLLNERPTSLAHSPQLPAAINQIFNLLRSSQPDGNKVLSPAELVAQLQASLQFQPLQAQPNSQTSSGALALAIQLLLGQLLRTAPAAPGSTLAQRLTQQLAALDPLQSAQLLRQLGGHSSLLQQAQLVNAEQQGALQQWLIPLALQQQGQSQFSQILLEERDNQTSADNLNNKAWQLTMKFDLGPFGPLLAKARLNGQQLSLQFYTEQPETLQLANKFLPLLSERCAAQGLIVTEAACQLGKIPETLIPRRTSLVQLKV